MSDDRINELRIENNRLKTQVEDLENKILTLVGKITLDASGEGKSKDFLNERLIDLINSSTDQLNIVSSKIDKFYADELIKTAQRGIPVLLITQDRRFRDKKAQKSYDEIILNLKNTPDISIINNPNSWYLLIFNTEIAIYSGGSLDKEELSSSVLIVTTIKEKQKIKLIAEIFSMMLPSFMRK